MDMADAVAVFENDTLILRNSWLERAFHARVGEPFRTASFINRQSGRDYARPASREFGFSVNGETWTTDDLRVSRIETHYGDPIEAMALCESPTIAVDVHLQIYARHPVVRKWLVIRNRGTGPVYIAGLDWEAVNLVVE